MKKKTDSTKVKLEFLNLVRLLLLGKKEMKNIKFMSNKLLNAETHWQTHMPLSVMVATHKSICLDENKT